MKNIRFLDSVLKMPLMKLPVRTVVINIGDKIVLISPGSKLSEDQLKSLIRVDDIIAPNLLHCGGVQKAAAIFPHAKLWGVQGARKLKPEIPWTDEISQSNWPYEKELSFVELKGLPRFNEVVFIHHDSRTLIVCDLFFNLLDAEGFGSWLILKLFGTYKKFGMSRLFLKFLQDRDAFEESLRKVFSYNFENIVVSHGNLVLGDGKSIFERATTQRKFKVK